MDIATNDRLMTMITGKPYTGKYNWGNIGLHIFAHTTGPIGLYLIITRGLWLTGAYCWLLHLAGIVGVTAGAHRLWTHRSYKANLPYRIMLMLMHTSAIELDLKSWVRWHRCHHKFGDTNADPHSIGRGFFFAHMGWTMIRPHEEYEAKKHLVEMRDMDNDPVVTFQSKYYYQIAAVIYGITIAIPVYFWGESLFVAVCQTQLHWLLTSHITYATNSLNHTNFGSRNYDANISASTSKFSIWFAGDGYHNFHHAFPMDYRTAEEEVPFNPNTTFIDFFARLGWVTDRKITSKAIVEKKKTEAQQAKDLKENKAA